MPDTASALSLLDKVSWYTTLGATGIVTEEATPLIGGLAVHEGHLRLTTVITVIAFGTWVAGLLLYYLGRWRGEWVRQRFPRLRAFLLRVFRTARRHPWRASLAVRFAFGLRLALPIACGAAQIPLAVYAVGSAVSALVWSALFTLLGWGFGETAQLVLEHVERYDQWIVLAIILAAIIGYLIARKRRPKLEEEVEKVIEGREPP